MQKRIVSKSSSCKLPNWKLLSSLILCAIALTCCINGATAQTSGIPAMPAITSGIVSSPSFLFTGNSRLTTSSESPQPVSSGLPNNFARWEFNPTLAIYEIPIGAKVLLTTENDPTRNAMNSYELEFDVQAFQNMLRERALAKARELQGSLKDKAAEMKQKLAAPDVSADLARYQELSVMDSAQKLGGEAKAELDKLRAKTEEARAMAAQAERYAKMNPAQEAREKEREIRKLASDISDPNKLVDKLKEMDIFSGWDKFLFGFKELGIGKTYPNFSPMVLTGMSIDGASLVYTSSLLTIGGAGGTMNPPLPDGRVKDQVFKRTAYAAKIGLGSTTGTHLHFIGFFAEDDANSAKPDSAYSPERNHVFAADGRLDLLNHSIRLASTAAASVLTRDITAPTGTTLNIQDKTLQSVAGNLKPNISSTADYAWTAETEIRLFQDATQLKAKAERIGPAYMTLGVPYLRTDIIGREAEVSQSLFSGAVAFSGYYRQNQDNILPWKRTLVGNEWVPARTTMTSYGGTFSLQPNDWPSLSVEYAPFLQETAIDTLDSTASNQTTMLTAASSYSYQIGQSMSTTTLMAMSQQGTSHGGEFDFGNDYFILNQNVAFESFSLMLGGSYTSTEIRNSTTIIRGIIASGTYKIIKEWKGTLGLNYNGRSDGGNRLGFFVQSSIKLWKNNELQLRAEKNTFEPGVSIEPGYDQFRFRAVLFSKW